MFTLAPLASAIPLCCLSAILFVVSWSMSESPQAVRMVRRAPKPDASILVLTFLLTVFVDLVVAVNVGVIVAALMFTRRSAEAVQIEEQPADAAPETGAAATPAGVVIDSIQGPFFFGAAEKLERSLAQTQRRAQTLILRMGHVPFVDATGFSRSRRSSTISAGTAWRWCSPNPGPTFDISSSAPGSSTNSALRISPIRSSRRRPSPSIAVRAHVSLGRDENAATIGPRDHARFHGGAADLIDYVPNAREPGSILGENFSEGVFMHTA